MLNIVINILLAIHVLVCALLVFIVLLQRPRNEGLGSAFGGGMTESMFGAQTSSVLAKFTVWLGGGFFALTLLLSMLYAMRGRDKDMSDLVKDLESQPVPEVETVTPEIPGTSGTEPSIEVIEERTVEEPGTPDSSTAPAETENSPADSPAPETSPETPSESAPADESPAEAASPEAAPEASPTDSAPPAEAEPESTPASS